MKKIILLLLLSMLILTACETKEVQPAQNPNSKIDYEKINQVVANSTMLMKQISEFRNSSDKYCTESFKKFKYTDSDYANFKRINIGYLETPQAQEEIKRILGEKSITEEFTKDIKKFYIDNEKSKKIYDWTGICKKDKEVYAFFTPTEDPSYMLSLWKDSDFSKFFHDENMQTQYFGNDGGVSSFLTNALGEKSLIYNASEDLPIVDWTIYSLDPANLLVKQIEKCKLTFEYTQKPFWVNADKYTLTCDKQYKP
jgi:hypothetical protein